MNGQELRETVQAMRGLPWAARALYLYLATYGSPCWPSVATLARDLGTAERYVRRLLRQLERAGVLERVDHQGRTAYAIRTYRTGPMSPESRLIGPPNRTYESGPMSPDLLVRTYESAENKRKTNERKKDYY